jgi:hypothetical protein
MVRATKGKKGIYGYFPSSSYFIPAGAAAAANGSEL